MDLARIAHSLQASEARCRAIVETPRGSRCKYSWNASIGTFELSGLLPIGMVFPMNFGMVPSTLADDGDPLDILLVGDEPASVGCAVDVQLLGVIKAEQSEHGRTYRNDRLVGRPALSVSYQHTRHVEDLGSSFVNHVGRWFTNYNALKGKGFAVLGIGGSKEAIELIEKASAHFSKHHPVLLTS
jgi:inorganic pyrophosphatase